MTSLRFIFHLSSSKQSGARAEQWQPTAFVKMKVEE